jgi:hypothetical protein
MSRFPPAFNLNSLMLIIALIAVCMAVARATPYLGIPLSVLSAIALARASVQTASGPSEARTISPFDKMIQFFVSVAIVLIVGSPAIVSFMLFTAVCIRCQVDPVLGLIGGIVAAGGTGYGVSHLVRIAIHEWDW